METKTDENKSLTSGKNRLPTIYEPTPTDKIYKMILELPTGGIGYWTKELEPKYLITEPGIFTIPDKWDIEKRKQFIEIVKTFINRGYGSVYSFYIYFNNNYSSLIKRTTLI